MLSKNFCIIVNQNFFHNQKVFIFMQNPQSILITLAILETKLTLSLNTFFYHNESINFDLDPFLLYLFKFICITSQFILYILFTFIHLYLIIYISIILFNLIWINLDIFTMIGLWLIKFDNLFSLLADQFYFLFFPLQLFFGLIYSVLSWYIWFFINFVWNG